MNIQTQPNQARQAVAFGKGHHKFFKEEEGFGMIDEPYFKDGWWRIPFRTIDDSTMFPDEAINRIQMLKEARIFEAPFNRRAPPFRHESGIM